MTLLAQDQNLPAFDDTAWWRQLRSSRVVQVAVILILVQLSYRVWATFGAWYTGDDFYFITRMLNRGLSPGVAASQYAGHIMPAPMYLSWLFNQIAPFRWWPAASFLVLMQAVAAVGLLRLLIGMFGARAGILPPLALYLFTVFSVPISIWWAAGANQLPLQIALFWGLHSLHRYLRDNRLRDAGVAAAWVITGLLFYEKSILILGAYGILALCYFAGGSLRERLRHIWSAYRPAVIMYVALGTAYVAIYIKVGLTFSPERVGQDSPAPVAANMVLRDWLTGIFGGPFRWAGFEKPAAIGDAPDLAVGVCLVLFFLLLRELRRTRSGSFRALAFPAFFLGCDILLVLAGRASFVGPLIALDFRYQGESGAVVAIALACATMPVIGALECVRTVERSDFFDVPARATISCVAISALGLFSATTHVASWHQDTRAERYFHALLTDVRASKARVPLVDAPVPSFVMWQAGYPFNTLSHLLPQFSSHVRFVHLSSDHLEVVAADGDLRPAMLLPTRVALPAKPRGCGYRAGHEELTIPLTGPLAYGGWWVRLGYIASADVPMQVSAGGRTYATILHRGLHSLYFLAGEEGFSSITISALQGDASMCTDEVTVGRPQPAPEGGQ